MMLRVPALTHAPDVLVLAGGGVLGEAWMQGLLAGYEDATGHDFRTAGALVGTSAGSIVAATLVAGRRPRRPGEQPAVQAQEGDHGDAAGAADQSLGWRRIARDAARLSATATAPLAPAALALGAPGGAAVRAGVLARAGRGTDGLRGLRAAVEEAEPAFDGRLRVVAVDRRSGRRVVFGAPGAPAASVAEAVQASCSIPWVFRPVRIGEREYVDGGAWSVTNLDVAPVERGSQVLCLHPTLSLDIPLSTPMGALRALGGAGTALETATLRRRGARVQTIGPAPGPARLMSRNLMDRRPAAAVLEGGYVQGLRLAAAAA
jgi:NTE family protein